MADDSRIENILDSTLGDPRAEVPSPPFSRIEEKLIELKEAIESGGGGGGTTNYNQLTNKPSINSHTLQGSLTLDDLGIASKVALNATVETLELVSDEVDTKVDKVTGKGLSTNDYTDAEKTNLATALSKANAAAPQSTTYTKTEVDAALAAKLNTADVDDALSSTSTNPVQNKVVQALTARLVDAGAKNLLENTGTSRTINGVSFTVNDDGTVSVTGTNNTSSAAVFYLAILPADTAPNYNGCRLTGCPQGGSTSTYRLGFQLNSGSFSSYAADTGSGATIHDVPSADCRVVITVYPGATVDDLTFKPMICTAEEWGVSKEYVPYTPTLAELYQMVKALQNS